MPLLEDEPNLIVRDLLVTKFDSTNVSQQFETRWISTGWWDEDSPHPQITVTGVDLDTSPDAMDATGKGLVSWADGLLDCNVWVPDDEDEYGSTGAAKKFRWDLTREVHRIIEANSEGTTDDNGNPELTRLETGSIIRNPGVEPPPFVMLVPIGYQFETRPA